MNKIISTILLVAMQLTVIAQSSKNIQLNIASGIFKMGETEISKTWELKLVQNQLTEKPSIDLDGMNSRHTYDESGILLFESKDTKENPTGIVSEIGINIASTDTAGNYPNSFFPGTLKIENNEINTNLGLEDIKSMLKNYRMEKTYSDNMYRFSYMGIYMYLTFDSTETKLQKISFGKDKRVY